MKAIRAVGAALSVMLLSKEFILHVSNRAK
jgi:hypothetical protein